MPQKATKKVSAKVSSRAAKKAASIWSNKRAHVRFPASPEVAAGLAFNYHTRGAFVAEFHGLVLNESFKGCCLVVLNQREWTVGAQLWVKVGEVGPLEARVRWIELVSTDSVKLGLEFLE